MRYIFVFSSLFFVNCLSSDKPLDWAGVRAKPTVVYSEGLELTHTAFALAFEKTARSNGQTAVVEYHDGPYLRRTRQHFTFKKPPVLIHELADDLKHRGMTYYVTNRDGAPGLSVVNNEVRYNSPFVLGQQLAHNLLIGNTFSRHRSAWNAFARQYDFHRFFLRNKPYYDSLLTFTTRHLDVVRMQQWLETGFPEKSYQITIFISPLAGDLHSTSAGRDARIYAFVPPLFPDSAAVSSLTEARYANTVFTELDHHYCNVSGSNAQRVASVFANRNRWVDPAGAAAAYYTKPTKVFDEYVTHAMFLLYARDTYDRATFEQVKALRRQAMEKDRGFVRFGAFTDELLRLKAAAPPGQKLSDLYPALIDWCARQ